ncbi:hypothetical protein BJ165DRAFT_504129 [Panaeolus papilionaceus]|nr:hypothetical protein BJ165DRAFT_504129 [Panaeolus papilionaceus]
MASFSTSFLDSASSAGASVNNNIQSYGRAQYLVVGSTVAASEPSELELEGDKESQTVAAHRLFEDDYDSADEETTGQVFTTGRSRDEFTVGNLNWDEDYDTTTTTTTPFAHRVIPGWEGGAPFNLVSRMNNESHLHGCSGPNSDSFLSR